MSIESRRQRREDRRNFRNFIPSTPEEAQYHDALKRVKRIKGFYTHAIVFIVVNIMLVISNIQNLNAGESYFQFKNFATLLFWGIGLIAHGLSVFLPGMLLGSNWEDKKIKELMEKENNQRKNWE